MSEAWAIVPFVNNPKMTAEAVDDLLAQEGCEMRVLVIDKSEDREISALGREYLSDLFPRVLYFSQTPALPSLAATWNKALDFVWETGAEVAFVCNNDIRVKPDTWATLHEEMLRGQPGALPLFVSAIGVRKEQFTGAAPVHNDSKGGPDFSCFLISKECHDKYRFDEEYIPAFCEDCDYHRRLMLGGDGQRIYSIDVPYLHYGSQTIKTLPDEKRLRLERAITEGSRAQHARKWGGGVNEETYTRPFDEGSVTGRARTYELFEAERAKWQGR